MKSPPQCFSPANPDITGIGVRTTLYVQSVLAVLISVIAHPVRKRSPDSVAAIWRVQFYTLIAFYIAGIVQRATDNLSQFHETAAYHLGTLLLYSAFIGMLIEVLDKDAQRIRIFIRNPRAHWAPKPNHPTLRSAITQLILWYTCASLNPVIGHLIARDSTCDGHVTWVFLFGLRATSIGPLTNGWDFVFIFIYAPVMFTCFLSIICVLVTDGFLPRWRYEMSTFIRWSIFPYLVFWVEEVVAIERSLKANPGLDQSAENAWQFGQIVPLVLLIPCIQTLIEQVRAKSSDDNRPGPGGGWAEAAPLTLQSALPPRVSTHPGLSTQSLYSPHYSLPSRASEP